MFFTLSYTAHTVLSISLHILGIIVGLFVWYLFPKNPTRSIVQLPAERVALTIDFSSAIGHPMLSDNNSEKLIDINEQSQRIPIRQYG